MPRGAEHDRNGGGGGLGIDRRRHAARRRDHRHVAAHQVGDQLRQPRQLVLRPAIFDRYISSLDKADLAQPFAECLEGVDAHLGRAGGEIADHGHR